MSRSPFEWMTKGIQAKVQLLDIEKVRPVIYHGVIDSGIVVQRGKNKQHVFFKTNAGFTIPVPCSDVYLPHVQTPVERNQKEGTYDVIK